MNLNLINGNTTNFNNIRERDHCYRTWKNINNSRKNVIPSNSRPLYNQTLVTKCGIFNNLSHNINYHSTNILDNFIVSRHPSSSRTKCQIDGDGNQKYINIKAKSRPIKHWRKQLYPNQGIATRSTPTISLLERPGGKNMINIKNPTGIVQEFITLDNGCSRFEQYQSFNERMKDLRDRAYLIIYS